MATFEEKTISSEWLYEGKILNLRRDKVIVSSGRESYREIIEHRGAVGLVAVTEEKKLVLVKQFRKALEQDIWEIPAGKIEENEDPQVTAIRELKEETGYTAETIRLLTKIYPAVGYSEEGIYLYLCENLTAGATEFDDSEALDIAEFSLEELEEMALSGEIQDAKTLSALFLFKLQC